MTITGRSRRVLRPDHIRGMHSALRTWKRLPAASRANLIAYLTTDDVITSRDEREAAAALLASIDVTLKKHEARR